MRQNCSFREIGIFSISKSTQKILKMSLRMNLSKKTTHAIRISLWHVTVP